VRGGSPKLDYYPFHCWRSKVVVKKPEEYAAVNYSDRIQVSIYQLIFSQIIHNHFDD
jgi:hypothetical protein